MLRRLHKDMVEDTANKLERKKSKRQRLIQLFKWRKKSPAEPKLPPVIDHPSSSKTPKDSKVPSPVVPEQKPVHDDESSKPAAEQEAQVSPTPPVDVKDKVEVLDDVQIRGLFSGCPGFSVKEQDGRMISSITYAWNEDGTTRDTSDSTVLSDPAFQAATLRSARSEKTPNGYVGNIVEVPSMLDAQGIEPGSIGSSYFLGLPRSDSLATDLEQSQSSRDFLEASRNKELLQKTPDRIGIRAVDISLVHQRLVELQDLYEAFQESPVPMTIIDNQSSGDLYANLFTKFLMPPGFETSSDDPTGLQIQILTLIRILRLKGIWYNFSFVEWRIRLGQILWSDPEPVPEHEAEPLWTERDILLLQITLSCELLLRLDAVTSLSADDPKGQHQITSEEIRLFLKSKNRKVDWDLVLARRFLDNVVVVKQNDTESTSKAGGFLSAIGMGKEPESPTVDLVLLPQHQRRQFAGLDHFAKALHWPDHETFSSNLAQKIGIPQEQRDSLPSRASGEVFDPITPGSISMYGTPLQTPRSAGHMLDGYFGHIGKPTLSRGDSRLLRVPLSPSHATPSQQDTQTPAMNNIGGWLSRSFLTALILPGEAISHFLISTLLENDRLAIARLGDSANLYGGFTFGERTWWSKNSIVGRVLACLEGSAECMGWITCSKLPEGFADCWHSIHSEQLPLEDRLRNRDEASKLEHDSAAIPSTEKMSVKPEDYVLPTDPSVPPTPSLTFAQWELSPLNTDLMDSDALSLSPTESDIHVASITFTSQTQETTHTLSLAYDIQFITSWPCTTPASIESPTTALPQLLRRSLTRTLSSSSRRSETLSRRNSHGFEPLLSHPPNSADIAPKRMYTPEPEEETPGSWYKSEPLGAHPLHKTHRFSIAPVTEVLDPSFALPFEKSTSKSSNTTPTQSPDRSMELDPSLDDKKAVLVLDARNSVDLELLARAWCAEKGLHAIIGRVERTCLACSIREARALHINIVIRVGG